MTGLWVGLLVGQGVGSVGKSSSCKYLLLSIFGFRAMRTLVMECLSLAFAVCVVFFKDSTSFVL